MRENLQQVSENLQQVSENLQQVRSFVRGLLDPAALLDTDLQMIECNIPYVRFCGLGRRLNRRIKSRPFHELVGRDGDKDIKDARRAIRIRQPIVLAEETIRSVDGQTHVADISFVPILGPDNEVLCLVQIIRDVSVEARIREQYQTLLQDERDRSAELDRLVKERTQELVDALQEVGRLSRIDSLTDLLNRRAFVEQAETALSLAHRKKRTAGILLGDLDHFKLINDNHGHQAGDAALIAVADCLRRALRKSDIVARFGGEEFIAFLTEASAEGSVECANRCCRMLHNLDIERVVPGRHEPLTMSVGVALYPTHGSELDILIKHADEALYAAKRAGRDRVIAYDTSLVHEESSVSFGARSRVLVVSTSGERIHRYREALVGYADTIGCQSRAAAIALCQAEQFDAIVADEDLSIERVLDLFLRTARTQAGAVRVLVTESTDMIVPSQPLAPIHCLVRRVDVDSSLASTVEDSRTLQDIQLSRKSSQNRFSDFHNILAEQSLGFAYQPIVRTSDQGVYGYEALLRVPGSQFRGPMDVIETALESNSIWAFGRLVRSIATQPLASLPDGVNMFINIHPDELEDPMILDQLALADRIVFEITERTLISDFRALQGRIKDLQEKGYRIAVDDLGSGYASLNSVAMLDPDFVKLDAGIIRDIHLSSKKVSLARKLVDYAREVGIKAVAEGVETEQEAEVVGDIFDLAQGFYYGRPQPIR